MLSLEERHKDRAKRKAEAALLSPYNNVRGGIQNDDGTFVEGQEGFIEGEDGFGRAGIGVVNSAVSTTIDPSKVVDLNGQTDPVTGKAAKAAIEAAKTQIDNDAAAHDEASRAAADGWGANNTGSLSPPATTAQGGNGGGQGAAS